MSDDNEDAQSKLTLGDIRNLIKEVLGESKTAEDNDGPGDTGSGTDNGGDSERRSDHRSDRVNAREGEDNARRMVKEELERLKAGEEKKKDESDLREEIRKIWEALKGEEKVPVERRKVHKFMGWGE